MRRRGQKTKKANTNTTNTTPRIDIHMRICQKNHALPKHRPRGGVFEPGSTDRAGGVEVPCLRAPLRVTPETRLEEADGWTTTTGRRS